jgi:hypothetical protein
MHRVIGSNPGQVNFFFFHAAAMLFFYIVQRIINQSFVFSENLQPYMYGPTASGASLDPAS